MVLEASVGVNNQNLALLSTLTNYQFTNPMGLKLEFAFDCEHQLQPPTPYLKSPIVRVVVHAEIFAAQCTLARYVLCSSLVLEGQL